MLTGKRRQVHMSKDEQDKLDKIYEDFMSSLKKKDSVLYYQLRNNEVLIKEGS
jgi:hypothetical protein